MTWDYYFSNFESNTPPTILGVPRHDLVNFEKQHAAKNSGMTQV